MNAQNKLKKNWPLLVAILTIISLSWPLSSSAELVEEEEVATEGSYVESELPRKVIITKRKRRRRAPRRVEVYRTVEEDDDAREQSNGIDNRLTQKVGAISNRVQDAITEKLEKTLDSIDIQIKDSNQKEEPKVEAAAPVVPQYSAPVQAYNDVVYDTMAKDLAKDAEDKEEEEKKKKGPKISFAPTASASFLSSDYYDIDGGTTLGAQIEVAIAKNISMTMGYAYAQYDIGLGNEQGGFYYDQYGSLYGASFYESDLNTLEYNQNVFDAGVKYSFFHESSAFRPFIGAGLALVKGYLNYSQETIDYGNDFDRASGLYDDYEVTTYNAVLTFGADVNFSKNFGIGLVGKYHAVVSADESTQIRNRAFLPQNGSIYRNDRFSRTRNGNRHHGNGRRYDRALSSASIEEEDKDFLGGSLKDEGFFSIGAALKFSF